MSAEFQLRQYVVEEGKWDEFINLFPAVVSAREAAGFSIVGVWGVPTERRFIWIVSTDHADGIDGASRDYYKSPERNALDPEPATLLADIQTTTMKALPAG